MALSMTSRISCPMAELNISSVGGESGNVPTVTSAGFQVDTWLA